MRKELDFVAQDGRDAGRVYRITEMSARQTEIFAARLLFALMNAGVEVPENGGLADLLGLEMSAFARLRFDQVAPLFDEMMGCVKYVPTPSMPNVVRPLIDEDIDEVSTRLKLRKAVFDLHAESLKNAVALS